jgi:hypothetical protein
MQLVDYKGQPKYNSEGRNSAKQSVDQDILEILAEVFFLEIVSSSEYHGRQ